jgi:hypothetical protein
MKLDNKWVQLSQKIATNILREKAHISLIIRKNELLAIGTNEWKTHPKAVKLGYKYPWLHSELDAYTKLKDKDLDKLTLINLRFSKTGKLGMALPCKYCMPWCEQIFNTIVYSDENGSINIYR